MGGAIWERTAYLARCLGGPTSMRLRAFPLPLAEVEMLASVRAQLKFGTERLIRRKILVPWFKIGAILAHNSVILNTMY